MSARKGSSEPQTLVHVEGVVDAIVARQLGVMVAQCRPGSRLVLDFSHARAVPDTGLALLARALVKSPERNIALRGLSHHQERLLRYLGVERGG
jgi:STAS domain